MEKVILFFSLHPVLFYRQDYEKQKRLKLVTSLFLLQNIFKKMLFLVWPFTSGNCGEKKQKKPQNIEYLKNEKSFLEEIKKIFIVVEMLSFGKI